MNFGHLKIGSNREWSSKVGRSKTKAMHDVFSFDDRKLYSKIKSRYIQL